MQRNRSCLHFFGPLTKQSTRAKETDDWDYIEKEVELSKEDLEKMLKNSGIVVPTKQEPRESEPKTSLSPKL